MNEENKGRFSVLRIAIIIAAAVMLAAGLLLFNDQIPLFHRNDRRDKDDMTDLLDTDIVAENGYQNIYFEVSRDDPFLFIHENDNYSGSFTVTDSYNVSDTRSFLVTVSGERFVVRNDSYTAIYDGKKLYTKSSMYTMSSIREHYTVFDEIGVPSVEDIKKLANAPGADIKVSGSGEFITVLVPRNDNGITLDEFVISADNGIVTSVKTFSGDRIVRECSFSNISVLSGKDLESDIFVIPD